MSFHRRQDELRKWAGTLTALGTGTVLSCIVADGMDLCFRLVFLGGSAMVKSLRYRCGLSASDYAII